MANTMDKPAIFIAVPTAASDLPATLKPLLNGIEEEAIPVQTKVIAEDDVTIIRRLWLHGCPWALVLTISMWLFTTRTCMPSSRYSR